MVSVYYCSRRILLVLILPVLQSVGKRARRDFSQNGNIKGTTDKGLRQRLNIGHIRQLSPDSTSDPAVFYGSHNLWGDNIILNHDRTFKREAYEEGGTWSAEGATLTLVWDSATFWGSETSWTLDGGRTFSRMGFTLESMSSLPSLPSWWLDIFEAAPGQHLSPDPIDRDKILWMSRESLPVNEGHALPDAPADLKSLEECRDWCVAQACIGFKAQVEAETGEVKSWEPKKMATGFDPGSAVWVASEDVESEWQFHWRADPESVRRNDDGIASSLPCPPGLEQRPEYTFQCWDGPEGPVAFNKDGTVNFEQLIIEEMGIAWDRISHETKDPYRRPNETEQLLDMGQDQLIDAIANEVTKHAAIGLLMLAKLIGHGCFLAPLLAKLGQGVLVSLKVSHAPAIVPVLALFEYAKWLDDWRHRFLAAQTIIAAFLSKSMCMWEVRFRYSTLRLVEFKPELEAHCGAKLVHALHIQVPKTLQKMHLMFDYTSAIAWCMRGGAAGLSKDYAEGVKCSEHVLPAFKGADGRAGILTSALLLTAMWGAVTDDLFIEGSELAVHAKLRIAFGIDYPELAKVAEAEGLQIVPKLSSLDSEEKTITCTSLYLTQVAYEKAFARLAKGFEIWVRTFGIDDSTWWFSHPCSYMFNGWTDANKTEFMCKEKSSPLGRVGGGHCFKGRGVAIFEPPP